MRAITLRDAVPLARELADDDVVLVVAGRRDEQVGRTLDAGALEHEAARSRRRGSPGARTRPRACRSGTRCCSISVTSWPARSSERVRFAPTLPPPAIRTYIRRPPLRPGADGADERLDRRRGRADDAQAARRVELRRAPGRARGRSTVGTSNCFCAAWAITMFVLSPSVVTTTASASSIPPRGAAVRSIPWPTRKPPVQLLAESPEGVLVLVEHRHVPARALQLERDGRADPAAADHDRFHSARSVLRCEPLRSRRAPRRAPSAGRRRSAPRTGAWRSTKSTVGEKNRDWRRQRGAEPSTIRSASDSRARSTIACADRARPDGRRLPPSTPCSAPSSFASASEASARSSSSQHRRVERLLERDADHVQRLDLRARARSRA